MKKSKKIILVLILICTIFLLTGCSDNEDGDLKTKVISELDYVNTKTVGMLNKLNNISFENYSIISQEVKLSDEEKQTQTGGGSSSSSSGQESGSEGEGSSNSKNQETQQQDSETGEKKINTTNMVADVELNKDRNEIDWTQIKKEIEQLEESWAIIVLDLYTLNAKNETILAFSDKLNTAIVAVKEEDKQKSLTALADLYSSIPQLLQEVDAEKNMQKIRQTQNYVINAYILADDMNNTEIDKNITQAIQIYSEVMSDIDYTKDKTEKTNKIYVLLNELANSLDEKSSDVFYIKYKNLMKEIEAI